MLVGKRLKAATGNRTRTTIDSASIVNSGSGNVYVRGSFAPSPVPPKNSCNLPHRYPDFVGRQQEIQAVLEALASRAWIVSIDGVGGIGKTTLALEVAHWCREQPADRGHSPGFAGYVWTSARDNPQFSLGDLLREVVHVLGPSTGVSPSPPIEELVGVASRLLAEKSCLVIIDNFETVTDERLLRFLRDFPSPSKVVVTSRHHLKTGERVVTIGGLAEDDAVKLLRLEAVRLNIPLRQADSQRLRIVAQKAFGIPLALRWVMETVYQGKTLEWALESLEQATANDIFEFIFKHSLALLDEPTQSVFRSFAIFPSWTSVETVAAINPGVAALEERLSSLGVRPRINIGASFFLAQ